MANNVIRKNVDGIEVDFGNLVVSEIDGVRFASEALDVQQLGLEYDTSEVIPEFLDDLKLVINWRNKQIYVYPFDKKDIRVLGCSLSKQVPLARIDVQHMSRILMMWENGNVKSEHKTIDEFFLDMTEEQIERSRF